jgi:hypothetical protein
MFYHWPVAVDPSHVYGEAALEYGSGVVFGSGLTSQEVADIREIPRGWNSAHCLGQGKIVVLDPTDEWADVAWGSWKNQVGI